MSSKFVDVFWEVVGTSSARVNSCLCNEVSLIIKLHIVTEIFLFLFLVVPWVYFLC